MSFTVSDAQSRIAATLDQNESVDDVSSADQSLRLQFINRRERMWSEVASWNVLYKEYNTLTSTNSGNTSISLPADFRKLATFPRIAGTGVSNDQFPEINPANRGQFNPGADRFVEILGNENAGYSMLVNTATANRQIASGASIHVPYYSTPSSLATLTDVITCPDPDYIVVGVIADVWEAREDERFQSKQAEANIILSRMLEVEFTPSRASNDSTVKNQDQTKHSFRWGK